ncbi:hypothetical protein O181_017556 [Austropuccinia psidii MF-1]|uniref:Uncharacterized protein n=1 Tax=Austropuccinia psidii MF-1 TaxID=1389203 RepID=A0A9Q3C3M1_9BASI|nr:hypothetical protein [Austropuccinia psidii MF-1]
MPDPQRKDGGNTEEEDQVSSVSLKLITIFMEEKDSIQSDMHINPEINQGSEAITEFMPPKVLNMGLQVTLFMALDNSQWVNLAHLGARMVLGDPYNPHGLQTVAYRPQILGSPKGLKGLKMAKFLRISITLTGTQKNHKH